MQQKARLAKWALWCHVSTHQETVIADSFRPAQCWYTSQGSSKFTWQTKSDKPDQDEKIPLALRAKSVKLWRNRSRTKGANMLKADWSLRAEETSQWLCLESTKLPLFHQLRSPCAVNTVQTEHQPAAPPDSSTAIWKNLPSPIWWSRAQCSEPAWKQLRCRRRRLQATCLLKDVY